MEAHRVAHYPEPGHANGTWEDKAMFANAAAKRDRSKDHRKTESNLVDDRLAQEAPGGGDEAEQDGGRDAMHRAQAGKAHCEAVEPAGREWSGCHARRAI